MSNRNHKLFLYARDPHCHWCGRETKLICNKTMKGQPDPLMATIDHIVSRYSPKRWVKRRKNETRKVLACYECNQRRSIAETLSLSRAEIRKRSEGYSISPKGKPIVDEPLPTLKAVLKVINA